MKRKSDRQAFGESELQETEEIRVEMNLLVSVAPDLAETI